MDFLLELNNAVQGLENRLAVSPDPPPSIFIIGVPRSGTTLISQLLSACTEVGYVNNLMARFWMAPAVGARLSLEVLRQRVFTGHSSYGQTICIEEPHEFGGFWRHYLGYSDMRQKPTDDGIDWQRLVQTLNRISSVFACPVVYKVFQLYWHLQVFHEHLPLSRWIWVRRDPVENALSLLKMRKDKTGSMDEWFSAFPLGAEQYDGEPGWVQVAVQVHLIEKWIHGQLSRIPLDAWMEITLENLCSAPETVVKELADKLNVSVHEKNLQQVSANIMPEKFTGKDAALRKNIETVFAQLS